MIKKVKVLKSNPNYRIGDVILRQGYRWIDDSESILINPKFKGSILYEYLNSLDDPFFDPYYDASCTIPRGISNIDRLKSICLKKNIETNNDYLYIHIRCGDIVQLETHIKKDFFLYNIDLLEDKINKILDSKYIKKVFFVTAMHFGDFKEKNLWRYSEQSVNENISLLNILFGRISKIIESDVLLKKSDSLQNIDHHFCSLVSAENVILDKGGFSEVVSMLRKFNLPVEVSN